MGQAAMGGSDDPAIYVLTIGRRVRVTDGPFPEAKEAIGGYVLLTVTSLDEATAIAQRHPALAHGMIIEVRQLAGGCHLGVTTTARNRVQVAANA